MARQAIKTRIGTKIPSTQVFALLHCPKASVTILHGKTRRAATHIAYICLNTCLGVARGREHGLFALEIIERRLFNKKHQLANHKAQRCENFRTETRLGFASISKDGKRGIRREVMNGIRGTHAQSRDATTLHLTGRSRPT
jgi:hypothetical protein